MNTYMRHRFPPDIISYAVWLYYRFNLSHLNIEVLLAELGITVSREAIRLWCLKFGALYARRLKRKQRFVTAHAAVYNLLNLGRHLVSAVAPMYCRRDNRSPVILETSLNAFCWYKCRARLE